MRLRISSKFVEEMTKEEKKACYSFSLSGGKQLFSSKDPIYSDGRLRVFIARYDGNFTGEIIGWSTCDMTRTEKRNMDRWKDNNTHILYHILYWAENSREAAVFVNVRKKYRRQGVGTRLVKLSIAYGRKHKKAVRVFSHDGISKDFYDKMDIIVGQKTRLRKY